MRTAALENRRSFRFGLIVVLCAGLMAGTVACTVKSMAVPAGVIPEHTPMALEDEEFGSRIYASLLDDFKTTYSHPRYDQLQTVFDNLVTSANAQHMPWHLYLFDQPQIIDVRGVSGNYIFVWSGVLDLIQTDDEVAAVLATEIAHILAGHARPVQFTLTSQLFFGLAEVATSVGAMVLSQGALAIGGMGWMGYAYAELSDLDVLDREHSEEDAREALEIACLIMTRAAYSPSAMLGFWERMQADGPDQKKTFLLDHGLDGLRRVDMLAEVLPHYPQPAPQTENGITADRLSGIQPVEATDAEDFFYP